MARNISGLMCFFLPLRDLGVCPGAGDQRQEELPVHLRHIVTVERLARGVADGRAVHDWTAHWVLVALVLGYVLGKRKKRRRWRERRRKSRSRRERWKRSRRRRKRRRRIKRRNSSKKKKGDEKEEKEEE